MYRVQVKSFDKWYTLFSENKSYCLGYLAGRERSEDLYPEMRILSPTDKVVEFLKPKDNLSFGQVAGHITNTQRYNAAYKALINIKDNDLSETDKDLQALLIQTLEKLLGKT